MNTKENSAHSYTEGAESAPGHLQPTRATPRTRAIQAECAKLGPDYAVWYGYVCGELEVMEKELAEKDREIEAFKANNRYMRGHTAGYEEAERKWKTRVEQVETLLSENVAEASRQVAAADKLCRELMAERDILREEIKHIKAWANAKSDEVIALERNIYTGDDDEKKWLRAEVKRLKDQIGYIEASEHPDEQNPRAQTWLQERKNWIAEVERLRETLRTIKS